MEDLKDRGGSGARGWNDRVGLAWRREISSHILLNADKIDLIEVALDEYVLGPTTKTAGLISLMREIPTLLHGSSMGLAGHAPLDELRLARLRRILDRVGHCEWSERLFEPSGYSGFSITQKNIELLRERVGRVPDLENSADQFAPAEMGALTGANGADLLMDLNDIYAHAVNHGLDPIAQMLAYPIELVRRVHLSGGAWVEGEIGRHLVDDHEHDISEPVFQMLEELAVRSSHPLSVVIERDGNFPPFSYLLHEISRAREALARGRRRREPVRETPIISLVSVRGARV